MPRLKKAADGSVVYSDKPDAIRRRELRRMGLEYEAIQKAAAAGLVEINPASVSSTPADSPAAAADPAAAGVISHEEIGIKAAPKAKEPEAEEINYFCTTCHHRPIHVGDVECPVCEEKFDWEGNE
jgi:cytochrome c5